MFIRPCYRKKNGKRQAYWSLVESYRTAGGSRQRTVSYLGELDAAGRLGIQAAAEGRDSYQQELFDAVEPRWVSVNSKKIRVEQVLEFGGFWLGLELVRHLGLDDFLDKILSAGGEDGGALRENRAHLVFGPRDDIGGEHGIFKCGKRALYRRYAARDAQAL